MGEMADYYNSSFFLDYWEDDCDPAYWERPVTYKTCRYCGEKNLVWYGKVKGKWVLGTTDMKRHFCKPKEN